MHVDVYWRCFFKTSKIELIDIVFQQIEENLQGVVLTKKEKYWKDESLTELGFTQSVLAANTEQLIGKLLNDMSFFSNKWAVIIPADLLVNYQEFSGVATDGFKKATLNWISVTL